MTLRPNDRVVRLGVMLVNQVALDVAEAQVHLHNEHRASTWPSHGESVGGPSSSSSTATETSAMARIEFGDEIDDLEDAIWGAEIAVKHLARKAKAALDARAPQSEGVKRCADAQVGRDAPLWSNDLKCRALPDKNGLCQRHYSAWYRYRKAHGLDTSQYYEEGVAT